LVRAVFFAVLLAGLGIAAPASAVTPVSLGIGRSPAVAVDAAGTGHFVWASRDSGGHTAIINYCRIPAGQLACQGSQQLASLGADFSEPRILVRPADGAIIVIDSRCCTGGSPGDVNSYAIISTTGGTTWRPPVDIGPSLRGQPALRHPHPPASGERDGDQRDRQDQRQARPDRGGQEPGPHPRTQGSAQRHLQGDRGGLDDPRLHHHQHPDLPRLPQDRSSRRKAPPTLRHEGHY